MFMFGGAVPSGRLAAHGRLSRYLPARGRRAPLTCPPPRARY